MKVTLLTQQPFANKWLFTFFLSLFLFSFNSLQAQDYVSSDTAKDRLLEKAQAVQDMFDLGAMTELDKDINNLFIKNVLNELEIQDFIWSAEHKDKINQIVEGILQNANTKTLQAHPLQASKINNIENELDLLIQQ